MLNLHRNSFQALIRTTQVLLISITVVLASGCSGGGSGHASAPPSGDGGAGGGGTGGGGTGGGGTGGGGTGGGDTGGSQLTPDADAPPITAALGTALHHAQMCAQYLGPIPEMSCSDAQVVPITVDGVEVFETPRTCDKPSALTGTCETGERIAARYMGSYHNGLSRPEVVFVNFCRDGGMGVIGHNSETGATCFFHKRLDTFPNDVAHPGSDDPDSNYDQYWQPPAEVAADNCQECHQADPWIHSPWIDQLPDPAHPLQTLVPAIATKDSPYIVIGDDFSQPYHEGAPDNSCTSCHKPQCDDLFAVKLGELAMPGPFNNHDHVIGVTPDLQELRDWCGTIPRVNQIGGGNEE